MTKPFCIDCGCFMKGNSPSVIVYKERDFLLFGEICECPECGKEVISDFGRRIDYREDIEKFEAYLSGNNIKFRVVK